MAEEKKELPLSDLVRYYMQRYDMYTGGNSLNGGVSDKKDPSMFQTYRAELRRLLWNTMVNGKRLYDIINPEKGDRCISVEDFEYYCGEDWFEYIKTYAVNKDLLNEDRERYRRQKSEKMIDEIYSQKGKEDDEQRDAGIIDFYDKMTDYHLNGNQDVEEGYTDPKEVCCLREYEMLQAKVYRPDGLEPMLDKVFRQKGHELMLEAIYYALYDSFNWEKLKKDITEVMKNDYESPEAFGDPTPVEHLKARENLKSYNSYVGSRVENVLMTPFVWEDKRGKKKNEPQGKRGKKKNEPKPGRK